MADLREKNYKVTVGCFALLVIVGYFLFWLALGTLVILALIKFVF